MPTNVTRSQQSGAPATQTALAKETGACRKQSAAPEEASRTISGYGLPCSTCHLYYPADLDECPTCHHKERVSPIAPKFPTRSTTPVAAEPIPDGSVLEQEREQFLRQFKSQLLEAHAEIANAPESTCKFAERHPGEPAETDVCMICYERVQERLDVCEAALHIDLKEAAQIIYDAVWADPSDPGKTYQNAASALLTELRKRAGITAVLGPFQPLTH